MTRILFLCTRNSCRSQMAEGFARARNLPDVEVFSAGTEVASVHPMAVRVMKEAGIDISAQASKSLDALPVADFDIVIALCRRAAESCPVLPGHPEVVDWSIDDPAAVTGSEDTVHKAFTESRDLIRRLVNDLFDRGYLAALADAKSCSALVLNNISDGIIAHDPDRRIFFFNRAAETITGYRRGDVLGRDCHDVFPGRFCGGKCEFCEERPVQFDLKEQELAILTKDGDERLVRMRLKSMENERGELSGMLASFRDITREHELARRVGEIEQFAGIIGSDETMLEIFDLIGDLANSNAPVLIHGESGTGKELVAAAIHNEGNRAGKQFVPVNCGALPEALLESELFGHVKGAFTGAIRDKKGRFELADGGTIFLDEIGDISPSMQVKLLRVLQEGHFERVGSEKTVQVDVRVISATNRDLQKAIADGRFREDLYYRLNVVPMQLPPLRERRNDIPMLVDHILALFSKSAGREGMTVSSDVMDILMAYDWPGNVRELQNWIQFALVKCRETEILPEHLPPSSDPRTGPGKRKRRHRKLSVETVRRALQEADGNKVQAAKLLGVGRATLYRFLDDAGLS